MSIDTSGMFWVCRLLPEVVVEVLMAREVEAMEVGEGVSQVSGSIVVQKVERRVVGGGVSQAQVSQVWAPV